ncbi:recombinase family protein [Priestia flexa]|uniref:recombinase family protein n=1 Tax=Priestia flexa TaxID=86664 RepID=UPI0020A0FF32|nr:recombinase family protein [Priestia flexa]MCP1191536.1 recombinase family protein [Priestia flexa]
MKEVYGYIRVSTETQAEKGYGLSTQENAVKEYCKRNKLKLVELFKDEGVSGTEVNRNGLTDLLASLNGTKTVVVMNTSRLWRSDNAKVMIKRQLLKAEAEVLSVEQPTYSIYDKDPNDFLVNGMMELLDQYDRMSTNLKLAKGRRSKVKSGQKGCGVAPIGYKWEHNGDRPIIVVDEENAAVVKEMFKKYLEVKSIGKVQKYCDEKGYTTQRGKSFSAQSINNVLKNSFYKGDITHSDLQVEGQHEPIINKVVFGKVQALLGRNKRN